MSSETDLMFLSHGPHVTVGWPLAATDAFAMDARGLGCKTAMMVDETVVKKGCEGRLEHLLKHWRSTDDLANFVESRLKTTYCRTGKWTMKIIEERTDFFKDSYQTTHPEQTYKLFFPQKKAELLQQR